MPSPAAPDGPCPSPGGDALVTTAGPAMAGLEFGRPGGGGEPAPQLLRDWLTRLPSPALFHDRLEQALSRRGRSLHPVAALRITLAGGLTAGYQAAGQASGEELLIQVARRLRRRLRPSDTLSHLGGDDFAVILDDLDSVAGAALVAERLIDALNQPFILPGQVPIVIEASIGVALNTGAAESAIEFLNRAGAAMGSARVAGSGTIEVYDPRFRLDEPGSRWLR